MARSSCTNPQWRSTRRRYSNIVAVVDVRRRYFHRALDCRADPDARTARIRASDEKADLFTPVALSVLPLVGAFWSDALWDARLHVVGPTTKLFVLPLLLFHFARTARGVWVLIAF